VRTNPSSPAPILRGLLLGACATTHLITHETWQLTTVSICEHSVAINNQQQPAVFSNQQSTISNSQQLTAVTNQQSAVGSSNQQSVAISS
jgi:hypothetical protein